jgi:hypothetical protein
MLTPRVSTALKVKTRQRTIVHTGNGWPKFFLQKPGQWVDSSMTGVRTASRSAVLLTGQNEAPNQFHSEDAIADIGWGAFFSTLLSLGCLPVTMSSTSRRIWIIASQNLHRNYEVMTGGRVKIKGTCLSSSSSVSDSVGSISIQVDIGHEHVGGWKP